MQNHGSDASMPQLHMPICAYLADLKANNSKTWFDANRNRYEAEFLDPAKDLVVALAPHVTALDPPHRAEPKVNGSIRRLNRDVRFSKDKTPYDPRLHLIFWTGDHPNRSPGLHLVLHPDHLGMGAGTWGLPPNALERFRAAVLDDQAGQELADLLDAAAEQGFTLDEPPLKRVPKGYDADHPRADLLRHKGLVVRTHARARPPAQIDDTGALLAAFSVLAPINRWLQSHVM